MAHDKKHITPENITEWLASTGFIFPRNELELERFEQLYNDIDFGITGKEVDPDSIINGSYQEKEGVKAPDAITPDEVSQYRMAARNGSKLPKHIMDKILKNQNKEKNDSIESEDTDK